MKISKLLKELNPNEPLSDTILVFIYELGDLAKCIHRINREKDDEIKRGYLAEAKKALADVITQTRLICERLGFNFEDLKLLGEQEMEDKIKWRNKDA